MLYPLSYEGGGWRIPGGSPRRPWRTGGSTHELLLGLDERDDPLLVARVGAADVLLRDPVDDRPGGVTFQPFDDPATDDDRLVGVVRVRQGQRDPRIAPKVASLA